MNENGSVNANEGIYISGTGVFNAQYAVAGRESKLIVSSNDESARGEIISLLSELKRELDKIDANGTTRSMRPHVESLEAQMESKNPEKRMWKISCNGLMGAAEAVGKISPKILEIANKLARFSVGM